MPSSEWPITRANVGYVASVKDLYRGDFYTLTAYSTATNVWIAWQVYRPDLGEGLVQAFRRHDSTQASMTMILKGLDPDATYRLTSPDSVGWYTDITGAQLMTTGVTQSLAVDGALILHYHKL